MAERSGVLPVHVDAAPNPQAASVGRIGWSGGTRHRVNLARTCARAVAYYWLGALLWANQSHACAPPAERTVYSIHHETYGDIGSHTLTFRCDGDNLIVETDVKVDVKIIFVTVYKRRARYREVWRQDQLIAYDAWTDEAGDEYVTKVRIDDDKMIIDGVESRVRVPADTVSSHPWNADVIDRNLLFGMKDGRLLRVAVEAEGEEEIEIGDKKIRAKKYVVSGDIERELWYDQAGNWLRWRLESRGDIVDIVRQ